MLHGRKKKRQGDWVSTDVPDAALLDKRAVWRVWEVRWDDWHHSSASPVNMKLPHMNVLVPLHPCSACDTFICRFNIAACFTYTWSLLLLRWQAALGSSIYAQTCWHLLSSWRGIFVFTTRHVRSPSPLSTWHTNLDIFTQINRSLFCLRSFL